MYKKNTLKIILKGARTYKTICKKVVTLHAAKNIYTGKNKIHNSNIMTI
jgi:hypothetical protein